MSFDIKKGERCVKHSFLPHCINIFVQNNGINTKHLSANFLSNVFSLHKNPGNFRSILWQTRQVVSWWNARWKAQITKGIFFTSHDKMSKKGEIYCVNFIKWLVKLRWLCCGLKLQPLKKKKLQTFKRSQLCQPGMSGEVSGRRF